jgi:ABC-type branched-subunit amino acid transport system substrate-binding protein
MAAADGENIKKGIEFAKAKLQEEGITLNVVYVDDGSESAQTVSAVAQLADVYQVEALVGPTWSFLAAAAADTISDRKVVAYSPANTSEHVTSTSSYFLFGAPKNSLKANPSANWLRDVGATRVAIVVDDGAWGESHVQPFTQAVQEAGATLVHVERVPMSVSGADMQTLLAKLATLDVDAVLYTGLDQATALIVTKKQALGADFALLAATEILRKQAEEGVVSITADDDVYLMRPETSKHFEEAYAAHYNEYPGPYADRAYDGTMLLARSILSKPADVSLNDYVRSNTYEGYMGTYSFDENNDLVGGAWVIEQMQ